MWTELCPHANSYAEALPLPVIILEVGPLKRWLRLNEIIKMFTWFDRRREWDARTFSPPCEKGAVCKPGKALNQT